MSEAGSGKALELQDWTTWNAEEHCQVVRCRFGLKQHKQVISLETQESVVKRVVEEQGRSFFKMSDSEKLSQRT